MRPGICAARHWHCNRDIVGRTSCQTDAEEPSGIRCESRQHMQVDLLLRSSACLHISVCAAILLQELTQRLRNSSLDWKLKPEDIEEIKTLWLNRNLKDYDALVAQFKTTL